MSCFKDKSDKLKSHNFSIFPAVKTGNYLEISNVSRNQNFTVMRKSKKKIKTYSKELATFQRRKIGRYIE